VSNTGRQENKQDILWRTYLFARVWRSIIIIMYYGMTNISRFYCRIIIITWTGVWTGRRPTGKWGRPAQRRWPDGSGSGMFVACRRGTAAIWKTPRTVLPATRPLSVTRSRGWRLLFVLRRLQVNPIAGPTTFQDRNDVGDRGPVSCFTTTYYYKIRYLPTYNWSSQWLWSRHTAAASRAKRRW